MYYDESRLNDLVTFQIHNVTLKTRERWRYSCFHFFKGLLERQGRKLLELIFSRIE